VANTKEPDDAVPHALSETNVTFGCRNPKSNVKGVNAGMSPMATKVGAVKENDVVWTGAAIVLTEKVYISSACASLGIARPVKTIASDSVRARFVVLTGPSAQAGIPSPSMDIQQSAIQVNRRWKQRAYAKKLGKQFADLQPALGNTMQNFPFCGCKTAGGPPFVLWFLCAGMVRAKHTIYVLHRKSMRCWIATVWSSATVARGVVLREPRCP
jgi:hypothetical protein